jgi:hypothetical protein
MLVSIQEIEKVLGINLPWRSERFHIGIGLKELDDLSLVLHRDHNESLYLEHKKKLHLKEAFRVAPSTSNISYQEIRAATDLLIKLRPDLKEKSFEEFCLNVQEDIALWKKENDQEWLAALNISNPNHWAPEEKIGKSFMDVHAPVPEIGAISSLALKLFTQSYQRGPTFRLAWGLATDTLLDHHPYRAPVGRVFNPQLPELYIRLERQVLIPVESYSLMIFTIRTYFIDCKCLGLSDRTSIAKVIQKMKHDLLVYKGLEHSKHEIIQWLLGEQL